MDPTENRQRQFAGQWYLPDEDACARTKDKCREYDQLLPSDTTGRTQALAQIVGEMGENVTIHSPFVCDYGKNIHLGSHVFINHGSYLMDGAPITIGDHVFIGPDCGLYTAIHPIVATDRNTYVERAEPITIESDVWLGGRVTVCPGVTIGRGAVIGAGSVVTHDVPAGVVAVGNPCHVLRPITERDRIDPAELRHLIA